MSKMQVSFVNQALLNFQHTVFAQVQHSWHMLSFQWEAEVPMLRHQTFYMNPTQLGGLHTTHSLAIVKCFHSFANCAV
jgi:hypothetical protein